MGQGDVEVNIKKVWKAQLEIRKQNVKINIQNLA